MNIVNIRPCVVVEDALKAFEYAQVQLAHLEVLLRAIQDDQYYNEGEKSIELADLGRHLSSDCYTYLSGEAENIKSRICVAGGKA